MAIKRIGVLTSGGDASGMNAAVRAVVRTALDRGLEIYGIHEGFRGLIEGGDRIRPMNWNSVGGMIHRGGTIIGTARSPEFTTRAGRLQAARNAARLRHRRPRSSSAATAACTGADVFRREWAGLLDELVAQRRRPARRGHAAPAPHGRRPGRLDRQRRVRHRHDDRRRHRAAPDHRGDRRHQQHRVEPPAHVRGRGDGAPLRLPGPDERDRHRRRLAVHPRAAAGERRLGGRDGGGPQGRPRGGPPRRHRHRRRRRHRPARAADHERAPPRRPRGRDSPSRCASRCSATCSAAARRARSTATSAPSWATARSRRCWPARRTRTRR